MTEITRRGQREDIRVTEKKQWYSEGRKLKMKVKEVYEASKAGSDAAGGREFIALLFPLVSYSTLLSPRSSPLLLFIAVSTSNMSGKTGLQTLANSWQNLNILSTSKWTTGWAGQYIFVLSGWFQGPNYLYINLLAVEVFPWSICISHVSLRKAQWEDITYERRRIMNLSY